VIPVLLHNLVYHDAVIRKERTTFSDGTTLTGMLMRDRHENSFGEASIKGPAGGKDSF
jgi:hypothetical protein